MTRHQDIRFFYQSYNGESKLNRHNLFVSFLKIFRGFFSYDLDDTNGYNHPCPNQPLLLKIYLLEVYWAMTVQ